MATNLATGLNATVTAPFGFEVSLQGTTIFSGSLTLTQTTSGVINRIVLVRLKAQTSAGTRTGNITNTLTGLSKTVAVSGTVAASFSGISRSIQDPGNRLNGFSNEKELVIKTFPNPFTDKLTVEFSTHANHRAQLRVLNLQGTVLSMWDLEPVKSETQQVKFSLAMYPRGIYFIELVSGSKSKTVQVIKL